MDIGGPDWDGWTFGSYGKSSSWRLNSPTGESFVAAEINEIRRNALDLDWLRTHMKEANAKLAGSSLHLTPEETQLIRITLQILLRELPVQHGRRNIPKLSALLKVVG